MPPVTLKNLDWRRMGLFIAGTFLVNLSIAGLSHQPVWPAVKDAFWQAALFAGGFCQNPSRAEQEMEAAEKADPPSE